MNNSNYNNTIYDEKTHPVTPYPNQLAQYLKDRFKLPDGGGDD